MACISHSGEGSSHSDISVIELSEDLIGAATSARVGEGTGISGDNLETGVYQRGRPSWTIPGDTEGSNLRNLHPAPGRTEIRISDSSAPG